MKTLLSLLLVFITTAYAEDQFFDTSYDCTKTTEGSVERSVCTDEHLAKLDKELSSIYSGFYYVTNEIKSDQREWMKKRNRCKDTTCIQKAYERRIIDLNGSLINESSFPKEILNLFNKIDMNMELYWDLSALSIQRKRAVMEEDIALKNEFFRFKDIHYQKPIVENVRYKELKTLLGDCYQFNLDIVLSDYCPPHSNDCVHAYIPSNNQQENDLTFSVWDVVSKEKKQLFVIRKNNYYASVTAYLLNKEECSKIVHDPRYYDFDVTTKQATFNFIEAFTNDEIEAEDAFSHSAFTMGTTYKGKFHLLQIPHIENTFSIRLLPIFYKNDGFLKNSVMTLDFKNKIEEN